MRAHRLAYRESPVVAPAAKAGDIGELLVRHGHVVVKDGDRYVGLVTALSATGRGSDARADTCLAPSAKADSADQIRDIAPLFTVSGNVVLPVFQRRAFRGVLRVEDVVTALCEENRKLSNHAEALDRCDLVCALSAGMGHDFNNILAAAIAQARLALSALEPSAGEPRGLLESIENGLMGARGLANQLLAVADEGRLSMERCDMGELVEKTVPFFLKGTHIELRLSFPADLPWVDVDTRQFVQVLSNLAVNAVQAMPDGGILSVRGERAELTDIPGSSLPPGHYLKLIVEDTGGGVRTSDVSSLFEPRFSTRRGNRGLGLAIVRSIVERHGGSIDVVSAVGVGTRFVVVLPLTGEDPPRDKHPGTITEARGTDC